jgi:hypothetical protein
MIPVFERVKKFYTLDLTATVNVLKFCQRSKIDFFVYSINHKFTNVICSIIICFVTKKVVAITRSRYAFSTIRVLI